MGVDPCLYGFTLNRAREEAVLVHSLYSHKKTRRLNILCTGYEHFKDSSVLYSDLLCFNMTVALWNKKYKKKKEKKEKKKKKEKEKEKDKEKEKKKKMEKSGIFDALRSHGMFKHNLKTP